MDYKTKKVDGKDVLYSSDWIHGLEQEIHYNWYYHQAKIVYDNCTRKDKILEIGIGTGVLSDILKKRKWEVTTLDIDEGKNPDICEDALSFNYLKAKIDVVLAYEVFEHIPFSTFHKLVEKLGSSKVSSIYFSLPWNEYQIIDFSLSLPRIRGVKFRFSVRKQRIDTVAHFWELSTKAKNMNEKKLVTFEEVQTLFNKHGYEATPLNKIGAIQYFEAKLI